VLSWIEINLTFQNILPYFVFVSFICFRHQFPFVILNVLTNRDKVDVNVTPDKRQVFVHNEKVLFAIIKTSLMEMYKNYDGTIETHQTSHGKLARVRC